MFKPLSLLLGKSERSVQPIERPVTGSAKQIRTGYFATQRDMPIGAGV
jgi:hypothetical protein